MVCWRSLHVPGPKDKELIKAGTRVQRSVTMAANTVAQRTPAITSAPGKIAGTERQCNPRREKSAISAGTAKAEAAWSATRQNST
mmetsp:Transcript_15533/g.46078  ORF Transcript_15533/g.46078 Transcript_15533/m.46078 type:complete len:85 (-) Transcript_15533:252-506(-)